MKWKEVVANATIIKNQMEKNKKLASIKGYNYAELLYVFSKAVKNPGKSQAYKKVEKSKKPSGNNINKKLTKKEYLALAEKTSGYIDKTGVCPNSIKYTDDVKIRPRLLLYCLAKVIVYYDGHKNVLPKTCLFNIGDVIKSKSKTTTTTKKSEDSGCSNPYVSTPHHLNQGSGYLGQTNPYRCGPHSLMQGFRKFGWDLSESTLASVAGTTTSGTDHNGLETAIAWVGKQKGVKFNVTWKNFSEMGSNDVERYKAVGEIACKPNKFVFFHIGYEDSGEDTGSTVFGHYEMCDKYNTSTKYVRALNSLGSRSGEGYYGHLQDRSFSLQSHYISNISQKSVCIVTKE